MDRVTFTITPFTIGDIEYRCVVDMVDNIDHAGIKRESLVTVYNNANDTILSKLSLYENADGQWRPLQAGNSEMVPPIVQRAITKGLSDYNP